MDVRGTVLGLAFASVVAGGLALVPTAATGASGSLRLVVGFAPGASAAEMQAAVAHAGARGVSAIADLHARVISLPASAAAPGLDQLRANPTVLFVEPDGTATPADITPNDPYFPTGAGALSGGEWGSAQTQVPAVWGVTTGSSAVTVAIVDSGVVTSQPDLAPVLIAGWNVLTGTADAADTYGHGTEVAGVAVSATNNAQGVAGYCWQCRLMPVKVYNSASAYDSDIANGVTWAVDHGARVINISLAGTASSMVLSDAVAYAASHGALVVAAAGNNGASTPTYPGAYPGVVSVAASDQTDTLNSYSNYGSSVDLAAPGSTPTTLPNGAYGAVGGTSVASPAVAGIAALLFSAKPTATPAEVTSALLSTTDPTAGAHAAAHGRVNAKNALEALTGTPSTGGSSGSGGTVSAPVASGPPTVSGAAKSGQVLTASTGTWSGSPSAYAYQWQRCDGSGGCSDVAGASASTYALGSADVGSTLRVVVTASNAAGSGSATSTPTAVVAAGTVTSTYSGNLTKSATSRSYPVTTSAGSVQAALSFTKCSSLSLALVTSAGSVVTQSAGASVLKVSSTVAAGSYSWVVGGSCRVSFTLTTTTAG